MKAKKTTAKKTTTRKTAPKKSKKYVESDEVRTMRNDIADMEEELAALNDDIAAAESDENEKVRNIVGPAFRGLFGTMTGMLATCKEFQKGVEHIDRMIAGLGGEEE